MKKVSLLIAAALFMSASVFAHHVSVVYRSSDKIVNITRTVLKSELGSHIEDILGNVQDAIQSVSDAQSGPPFTRYLSETIDTITIQAGYLVSPSFPAITVGEIRTGFLPGGRQATTVYVGPYSGIGTGYRDIEQFLATTGYFSVGAPWEIYLNNPSEVEESQLRTAIYWPVSSIAP